MRHIYKISGMTCNGCKKHVEDILNTAEGVQQAIVDLEKGEATIEMNTYVDVQEFQKILKASGGRYTIHLPSDHKCCEDIANKKPEKPLGVGNGAYYCPMHCEGEKTYNKAGDCPVCGMDLVEEVSLFSKSVSKYTCPMHPEVIEAKPGSCRICGMDLVHMEVDESAEQKSYQELLKKFRIATFFTLPIFLIAMSEMIPENPLYTVLEQKYWNWIQFILSIPVLFYATRMFFERAYRSIITKNLNMFTLIGIGAGVAWVFSLTGMIFPTIFPEQFKTELGAVHVYFEAATVILTLVLLGQLLEARAHNRTNSAVKELLKLAPNEAIRIVDGKEELIAVDEIKIGDILRVKPGDKIAVDGVITDGESSIDESMITGEPIPVVKTENDKVSSGTINGNQSFLMKAEKIGADTLLSQIISMVNKASRSKAPIQKLADKISGYFVPIVVLIAIVTFMIWAIWGPEPAYVYGFVNAIAVLIIACPCALGLATPMSVMVGVGKGAQSGILIKNAEALEILNKIDTLIVDKTGTLTVGKPSVEKVEVLSDHFSKKDLLQYLVSINQLSEHPLAQAIVDYGKEQKIAVLDTYNFKAETGKGVTGIIDNIKIAIGNQKLMEELEVIVTSDLGDEVLKYQKQGKTVSYIAMDGIGIGYVVISDAIKESSKKAIEKLQDRGVEVVMLTGDNEDTAKAVASTLRLTAYMAEMLPEDKLSEVERLQALGKLVAMAGDGINDAPALAKSDVGIAMGTGTDVAIESAEITLVKGDLLGVVKAHNLSEKVMKNIKQNLFFALIYNAIGIPIAAGILFPVFGVLLSPMIAALAMSFSSVSVIVNALRLKSTTI